MGRRQKYAQKPEVAVSLCDLPEHKLHLGQARRFDPDGGASAEDGSQMSLLTEMCTGDWSWKPKPIDKGHIFTDFEIDLAYPGREHRPYRQTFVKRPPLPTGFVPTPEQAEHGALFYGNDA